MPMVTENHLYVREKRVSNKWDDGRNEGSTYEGVKFRTIFRQPRLFLGSSLEHGVFTLSSTSCWKEVWKLNCGIAFASASDWFPALHVCEEVWRD